jgi:membrane-associated protein
MGAAVDRLVDYILEMDVYLAELAERLGPWAYAAIGAVIFAETGLVVAPFLPGESLLLTSGTLAGAGILEIAVLAPLLFVAAFLGDVVNYLIGRFVGRHLLAKPRRYLRPEHVRQAHEFYERHGGLAIVLARFLPIVRTLAPFVAGIALMEFHRFLFYAALASALWVTIFVGAGYWFGSTQWVQDYLALALAVVVAASATPGFVIYLVRRMRRARRLKVQAEEGPDREGRDAEGDEHAMGDE